MAVAHVASNAGGGDVLLARLEEDRVPKRIALPLTVVSMVPSLIYASVLPHLFFFLEVLDERNDDTIPTTHVFLGFILGAFSGTKIIISPLVGWMSSVLRLRLVLVILMLCQIAGAASFALARNRWTLIGSYILLGAAAANSTVCRVYVPRVVSSQKQRTSLLAWLTFGTTSGFIMGPALGALLALLSCSQESDWSALTFNGCTSPGWIGAALGFPSLGLIALLPAVPIQQTSTAARSQSETISDGTRSRSIFLTIASQQLAVVLPFAAIESLTAPVCAAVYGWTPKQVGILFSAGSFVTLPVPFITTNVLLTRCEISPRVLLLSSMLGQVLALCFLDDFQRPLLGNKAGVVQFVIGFCAFYIFYVIAQIIIFRLFYDLLATHPKCGVWVGWISSAGSLGRWVWPIVSVNLFTIGAGSVWLTTAAVVLLIGPGLLIINWKHLRKSMNEPVPSPVVSITPLTSEVYSFEAPGMDAFRSRSGSRMASLSEGAASVLSMQGRLSGAGPEVAEHADRSKEDAQSNITASTLT